MGMRDGRGRPGGPGGRSGAASSGPASSGPAGSGPAGRRWLRLGLSALAFEMLLLGFPATVAPAWFYRWFPFDRGWLTDTGPYNEHSVRDFGYVYLGFALVLVWAAVQLGRQLCLAASAGALLANAPHSLFHLLRPGGLTAADLVVENGLLLIATFVSMAVLIHLIWRPGAALVAGDRHSSDDDFNPGGS